MTENWSVALCTLLAPLYSRRKEQLTKGNGAKRRRTQGTQFIAQPGRRVIETLSTHTRHTTRHHTLGIHSVTLVYHIEAYLGVPFNLRVRTP